MTPTDIFNQAVQYNLNNVHTSMPATIVAYDYETQSATVQPSIKKNYSDGTSPSLPIVTDVPVIFPSGSGFSMSWPLTVGDSVLLIFSERSLDTWFENGGLVKPEDKRKFSLSDAIAIPGLNPQDNAKPIDNENFNIEIGNARMKINPDGTFCFHGVTEELMSILDELFTLISSITTLAVPTPGSAPVLIPISNSSAFTALQTRFNTLKGDC